MKVVCSQCGAKIEYDYKRRFIKCPFCGSSLIVERDRTFECFFLEHTRNDIWVKAVLTTRLTKAGITGAPESLKIEFHYFPVWHLTIEDGSAKTMPGAQTIHTEISSIKIPAGDLTNFEEGKSSLPGLIIPTVKPEAAFHWTGSEACFEPADKVEMEDGVVRLWLIYLPIYFIAFNIDGFEYRASLVGESTNIYSDTLPDIGSKKTLYGPLIFFTFCLSVFIALGILIKDPIIRVIAIGIGAFISILLSRFFVPAFRRIS